MNKLLKKQLISLLVTTLIIPIIGVLNTQKVFATSNFDVAYVNDKGGFDTVKSYSDFDSAYFKMRELGGDDGDYVVLSNNSLSPMKIVAMNVGFAYSYPYRGGTNTLSIYEKLNDSKLSYSSSSAHTYVAANNAMLYLSTDYLYPSGTHSIGYDHGYIKVNLGGFVGYTDLEYCDLVPMKFIENGWTVTLGGNSSGQYSTSRKEYNIVLSQNYYQAEKNGNYVDLSFKQYYLTSYTSGSQDTYKCSIGVAPDFMKQGVKYYSYDSVNFYSDQYFKNYVGTYYNYYQFVPARSYTNISENTINSFIKSGSGSKGVMLNSGSSFVKAQDIYGFNATLAAAIGIHESAYGTSDLAVSRNNLFGIAAYDESVGSAKYFNSVYDCISSLMGDVLANYLDVKCSWYYSLGLGTKGGGFITSYASDPYWSEEIASYYYAIDKLDNNNNGKLTDYNSETLYLVNMNSSVYEKASSSSDVFYNTQNKYSYQKYLIVPAISIEGKFAKVRTSCPIKNGEVMHAIDLASGNLEYDEKSSYGYIALDNLTAINSAVIPEEKDPAAELKPYVYTSAFDIGDKSIHIEGLGLIKGMDFVNTKNIKHQFVLKNLLNESLEIVYDLNTIKSEEQVSYDDGYSYDYIGFKGDIDISNLEFGNYICYIRIKNNKQIFDDFVNTYNQSKENIYVKSNDGYSIKANVNVLYHHRYEIEKLKTNIDYSKIKKATSYNTPFELYDINIDDKGLLNIYGLSFIQGLDFSSSSSPKYVLHLVDQNGKVTDINTEITSLDGVKNSLKNACMKATIDLNSLEGEYTLVLEINIRQNKVDYVDFVDVNNNANFDLPNYLNASIKANLSKSLTRGRLIINVQKNLKDGE